MEENNMYFDVSLIPDDVKKGGDAVCILIDVLRASSTMTTMMEKGCKEILLTDQIEDAFKSDEVKGYDDLLSCAENVAGNCREGCDFSPSLIGIEQMENLKEKRILMQTTNGTTAIHKLYRQGVEHIFVGCMRNAKYVMEKAVELANRLSLNINVVCAGRADSTIYTIDDLYCAAKLTEYGEKAAKAQGIAYQLNDSAKIALHAISAYDTTEEAFEASASGNIMRKIDCRKDIYLCAMDSIMKTVPYVERNAPSNYIVVKRYQS